MTKRQFKEQYNPQTRCYITYINDKGYKETGLLLDDIKTSTNGNLFCYVDSFYKTVSLSDIESIKDTNINWI